MRYKVIIMLFVAVLLLACAAALPAADRKVIDGERSAVNKTNTTSEAAKANEIAGPTETIRAQPIAPVDVITEEQVDMAIRNVMAGEDINWQVISGGGAIEGSSTNYLLSGAIGQTAAGTGGSTHYTVNSGFWQDFSAITNECDVAGDADHSGSVNISDAIYIINYAFRAGAPPYFMNEADANADCSLNISDAVYIINYAFRAGAPPICGCVYEK